MYFEIVGEVAEVETIARGRGIKTLARLRKRYGGRRWGKLKGVQRSASPVAVFAAPRFTGTKPTALDARAGRSSDSWTEDQ